MDGACSRASSPLLPGRPSSAQPSRRAALAERATEQAGLSRDRSAMGALVSLRAAGSPCASGRSRTLTLPVTSAAGCRWPSPWSVPDRGVGGRRPGPSLIGVSAAVAPVRPGPALQRRSGGCPPPCRGARLPERGGTEIRPALPPRPGPCRTGPAVPRRTSDRCAVRPGGTTTGNVPTVRRARCGPRGLPRSSR